MSEGIETAASLYRFQQEERERMGRVSQSSIRNVCPLPSIMLLEEGPALGVRRLDEPLWCEYFPHPKEIDSRTQKKVGQISIFLIANEGRQKVFPALRS